MERKLYRSRNDRMIAGVCGGLAEYFGMDPSVVRLLTVILGLIGNAAVLIAYIVLWVVVPEEPIGQGAEEPEIALPVASATAGPEYAAYAVDAQSSPSAAPQPEPAPPQPENQPYQPQPSPPSPPGQPSAAGPAAAPEQHGVRTGLIWFGILLIVLGGALLVDRMFPGLDLWGFWPATLVGVLFIVSGIRTMVTRGGEHR